MGPPPTPEWERKAFHIKAFVDGRPTGVETEFNAKQALIFIMMTLRYSKAAATQIAEQIVNDEGL